MTNFEYDEKTLREIIAQNCVLNEENAILKSKLHMIFALGFDYDGCDKAESLKELIDELVGITQMSNEEFIKYYRGV